MSESCLNIGYHRKYAIRLLNGPSPGKNLMKRVRWRGLSYGHQTLSILAAVRAAAGFPWSVRSKALLPKWMPWIRERFGVNAGKEGQLPRFTPR